MAVRILVFARSPVPGHTKTRLIPALGAAGAARLQAALVPDTVRRARAAAVGPVELWGAGSDGSGFLADVAAAQGVELLWQRGHDLGARMHTALAAQGGGPAVIIGSDCPALEPAAIAAAAAWLRCRDAVVTPALDGGYALLGVNRSNAALFDGVPWGSAAVMNATRSRLAALGWCWQELAAVSDLDEPADLAALAALHPGWRATLARLQGTETSARPASAGGGI